LERLKESHGVTIEWLAYELRPQGSPPMPEAYKARIKAMRPQFEAMAQEQYGLTINQGRFGAWSRPALIVSKYAEAEGKGEAFHQAMFQAYWQNEQDLESLDVISDVMKSVGLLDAEIQEIIDDEDYIKQVDEDILLSQQLQISGVPALLFNDKYFVNGAQPYDELARLVDYIRKRESEDE